MRTIKRTILTLALAAAVALSATPAHARRKAAKPPPVKSLLTTDEEACKFWGAVYAAIATDRDALIPITTSIDHVRKFAVSLEPNDPTTAATLTEHLVFAVHRVYAIPETSPAKARYVVELRCMQPAVADDPTSDAARVWR
jgi:hypothetical protein